MEDVIFEDLVSTSESGIRISAKLDRGGSVRNVSFRNLTFAWAQLEKKTFLFKKKKVRGRANVRPPYASANGTCSSRRLFFLGVRWDCGGGVQSVVPFC